MAYGFPKAIVHFDGDSFFASVEQALDYRLRGKPVVTGGERGAATALSYEAKRRGAARGMTMRQIRELVPDVIILPGNYTAYSIFAQRMYRIAQEFTPLVEEYSIDECFADITGLDAGYGMSYEAIARRIKSQLEQDLGITFGVGLAPTKTLAKIASSRHKPAGFTALPLEKIEEFLADVPMGAVWGVGFSTALKFEGLGVHTAFDFTGKDRAWLLAHGVSKPYQELWNELNGRMARRLSLEEHAPGSVIKSNTFRPTRNRNYLIAQLANNLEAACAKLRRHGMKARYCRFYLKTQSFAYAALILDLEVPLADPRVFLEAILARFDEVHEPDELYRATGISLYGLKREDVVTPDLFGKSVGIERQAPLISALDRLNKKYGRHTVHLAESLAAVVGERASRSRIPLSIEQRKKTLSIPHMGIAH